MEPLQSVPSIYRESGVTAVTRLQWLHLPHAYDITPPLHLGRSCSGTETMRTTPASVKSFTGDPPPPVPGPSEAGGGGRASTTAGFRMCMPSIFDYRPSGCGHAARAPHAINARCPACIAPTRPQCAAHPRKSSTRNSRRDLPRIRHIDAHPAQIRRESTRDQHPAIEPAPRRR